MFVAYSGGIISGAIIAALKAINISVIKDRYINTLTYPFTMP